MFSAEEKQTGRPGGGPANRKSAHGLRCTDGSDQVARDGRSGEEGVGAKQAWSLGAVAADAALSKAFETLYELIDTIPTDKDTKLLLKYLTRLADDYSACIAEAGDDPKAAAGKLLARKGVHLVQLLGGTIQEELVELLGALGEFLIVLPDRLRLMRLGGIAGIVTGAGLIANDLGSVGNGSQYLQREVLPSPRKIWGASQEK